PAGKARALAWWAETDYERQRSAADSESFDSQVSYFHFHRGLWKTMQLDSDFALHFAAGGVVIDERAHDAAINQLNQHVAAGNDFDVVPVVDFDDVLQFIAVAEGADATRFLAGRYVGDLAAQRQKAAAAFLIDLASICLLQIDIGL